MIDERYSLDKMFTFSEKGVLRNGSRFPRRGSGRQRRKMRQQIQRRILEVRKSFTDMRAAKREQWTTLLVKARAEYLENLAGLGDLRPNHEPRLYAVGVASAGHWPNRHERRYYAAQRAKERRRAGSKGASDAGSTESEVGQLEISGVGETTQATRPASAELGRNRPICPISGDMEAIDRNASSGSGS